uniref:Uncharacterized protein n=1 Tax=Ananas comosus var. bracteatus TaxID=296719 RepID=A0A6V7PG87_ANACO|nr:unnamed protein product [Ananas comosus var. bracteatus]
MDFVVNRRSNRTKRNARFDALVVLNAMVQSVQKSDERIVGYCLKSAERSSWQNRLFAKTSNILCAVLREFECRGTYTHNPHVGRGWNLTLTAPPPPCPTSVHAPAAGEQLRLPEKSPRPPLGSPLAPTCHIFDRCARGNIKARAPSSPGRDLAPASFPAGPRRPRGPPVAAETTCGRPDPCGPRSGPLGFQAPPPPTRGCTAFPSASATGSSPPQPSPAAATRREV